MFPKLTRLGVQMDTSSDDTTHWLARMSSADGGTRVPELRHLDLRACNVDGAALVPFIRVLHNLPTLTALGISSPPGGILGSRIFDILCSPVSSADGSTSSVGGEGWVLPRLQGLCFQNCRDVSGHEILRLVLARSGASFDAVGQGGVAPISFLKVSQCYGLDPDVHETLARAVQTLRVIC